MKTHHALCGLISGLLLLAAGTAQTHSGLLVPAAPGANLYVANANNNTIEKFTPGGVGSVFASTGLSLPTFLAFAPVPEPGTALFGLACVGVAALRRRRSA